MPESSRSSGPSQSTDGRPYRKYSEDGAWLWDGQSWIEAGGSHAVDRRLPVWTAAVAAAAMVVVVAGLFLATAQLSAQPGGGLGHNQTSGVHGLHICNAANYDENTLSCLRNQSGSLGETTAIYCTAVASGTVGDQLRAALTYNGDTVRRYTRTLKLRTTALVLSFAISPNDPLPGGRWSCQYTESTNLSRLDFIISGPTSPLLYPRACSYSAVQSFGAGQICTVGATSLSAPSRAYCGAVIATSKAPVSMVVAYTEGAGEPIKKTYEPSIVGSVTVAGAYLEPGVFGTSSTLPKGMYNCTWIANGRRLGSATFQVT